MQLQVGIITGTQPPFVQVQFLYLPQKAPFLCRPVLCGVTTGLHYMPLVGERVWVGYVENSRPVALCGLSLFDPTNPFSRSTKLPALLGGETAILGPTGSILKWVQAGGMQMTLLDSGGGMGTEQLVVNGGTRKVAADGDTITGSISAPSGGGNCSFTLHVQASNADVLVR